MILPDVNVLVYAYRREAEQHEQYADWLTEAANTQEVGLVETALLGLVRIATNPRIVTEPATTSSVLEFVAALLAGPRVRRLSATDSTWRTFADLAAQDRQIRGSLVPDAWLAAHAIAHGARLATADRGFARFGGLDWYVPVSGESPPRSQ